MVRKVTLGIFIAIFVIFLMSYNVSAVGAFNLDNYSLQYNYPTLNFHECNYNGVNNSNIAVCNPTGQTAVNITSIIPGANLVFKKGDVIQFDIFVDTDEVLDIREIVKLHRIQLNTANAVVQDITLINPSIPSLEVYTYQNANNNLESFNIISSARTFYIWRFEIKLLNDFQGVIGLKTSNNAMPIFTYYDQRKSDGTYGIFRFRILNYRLYRFVGSEENREQEQKTQEAVDQSTSDGNSSQTSVESSTQSLMSAGGSIISALVNAPATDCNISVQTTGNSRLFTTAIGQLNLCSDVPQGVLTMVQGIVALVFTPIVLYFTYNVLTTLYNQFKEYNS